MVTQNDFDKLRSEFTNVYKKLCKIAQNIKQDDVRAYFAGVLQGMSDIDLNVKQALFNYERFTDDNADMLKNYRNGFIYEDEMVKLRELIDNIKLMLSDNFVPGPQGTRCITNIELNTRLAQIMRWVFIIEKNDDKMHVFKNFIKYGLNRPEHEFIKMTDMFDKFRDELNKHDPCRYATVYDTRILSSFYEFARLIRSVLL